MRQFATCRATRPQPDPRTSFLHNRRLITLARTQPVVANESVVEQKSLQRSKFVRLENPIEVTRSPTDPALGHGKCRFLSCHQLLIVTKTRAYRVARLLRYRGCMNQINTAVQDADRLVDLLENILKSYKDSDSRPEVSLTLYRQCLRLGMNYKVRLAKHFVVIEGGASRRRGSGQLGSPHWHAKPRLRLAPKPTVFDALP